MTKSPAEQAAIFLWNFFGGEECNGTGYKRSPKGYRRIGAGCYRTAYLHRESSTVIKIGNNYANECEADNAANLYEKPRPEGLDIIVPRTTLVKMPDKVIRGRSIATNVIVQEYAADARLTHCDSLYGMRCTCRRPANKCFGPVLRDIEYWSGLDDIHGGNVLMDKHERFWLIDLGA